MPVSESEREKIRREATEDARKSPPLSAERAARVAALLRLALKGAR